jgi:hypothetical protein
MTTLTENGAISLANSGSARVNLFFKLVRNIPKDALEELIKASWIEDVCAPLDTMKILFQSRDCRGGKGDRTPFLLGMQYIISQYPMWFLANFKQISVYGRWLDYIEIYNSENCDSVIKDAIITHIAETLQKDSAALINLENVSLVAKWIPGEGKKWNKGCSFTKNLCVKLFNLRDVTKVNSWHYMQLRKQYLTPLRQNIKIVESQMCSNKWPEITYSNVPGVAMTNLNKAFMRHDSERFLQYLDDVKNKKNGAKINANVVYPHTIVEKYLEDYVQKDRKLYNTQNDNINDVYEMQWKVLEEEVTLTDTVVVSDVSGSMEGTPMMVSIALGILLATKNTSVAFKNQLITFDDHPQFIDISDCKTLLDKIIKVKKMPWGGSTNLQKTFDIILAKCLLHMEDAPKKLIIFSDMQFNEATRRGICSKSNFDVIINKFDVHNLKMPEIIFWNLRGDTKDFPVRSDTPGVTLLSGFSPTLLNSIMTDVTLTPYDILRQILDNPRYDNIIAPVN